ncbi:hypothetical protein [Saccharopolyspora sp. SCSIO 74807]|uniref:hypothetical protein n=1 Tax=Saccharopolyspora sp. SCSIO 74807 TaxID=3118084 RepID=UPI0030CF7DAA
MSYEEVEHGKARTDVEFSLADYRFRYVPGVVGESKRVVHQAVFTDGPSVWSLCRNKFDIVEVEEVGRCGMPCMQCAARAAAAATKPVLNAGPQVIEGSDVQ